MAGGELLGFRGNLLYDQDDKKNYYNRIMILAYLLSTEEFLRGETNLLHDEEALFTIK